MGLLLEEADLDAVGGPGLAVEVLVAAGHDLQQAGFARAVDAEHADLGAGEEGQGDVLEELLATGKNLGELLHDVDVLVGGHAGPLVPAERGCLGASMLAADRRRSWALDSKMGVILKDRGDAGVSLRFEAG